jgi:hypothetical protein
MTGEPEKFDPSDAVLLRYLLGVLPVDEADPIEEASIVDDDIAVRLDAMERDLVDNYVRGEMEGASLTKFRSWYLSSPLRVQKVEAGRAILGIADAVAGDVATNATHPVAAAQEGDANATAETPKISPAPLATEAPGVPPNIAAALSYGKAPAARKPIASRFGKLSTWPMLGFAAAVIVLIVTVGFLTTRNKQLRKEVAETKKQSTALTAQLADHAGATAAPGDKAGAQGVLAQPAENLATVTLFLPAPTRGASTIPKVDVPARTGLVVLSLGLGSMDEDNYRAQLLNPTTQKILWRSGILRPGSDRTYVSAAVPANVLHSQIYLVQLMHDAANGKPELLGTYPFKAEVK